MLKHATVTAILVSVLLGSASLVEAQVSWGVGIQIGAPPPPPAVIVAPPPPPAPAYVWVQGYWYPLNGRYRWHDGYWTRPPYEGAVWVAPRHDGERFYTGYWEAGGRRWEHDHRSDRHRERDFHHGDRDRD
jgi:hypothetical protein